MQDVTPYTATMQYMVASLAPYLSLLESIVVCQVF